MIAILVTKVGGYYCDVTHGTFHDKHSNASSAQGIKWWVMGYKKIYTSII